MYHPNQYSTPRRADAEFLRRMTAPEGCGCSGARAVPAQRDSCGCEQAHSLPHVNAPGISSACSEGTGNPLMPALAMVYSPEQEWRSLVEPCATALAEGTLFRELIKPFEGGSCKARCGKC